MKIWKSISIELISIAISSEAHAQSTDILRYQDILINGSLRPGDSLEKTIQFLGQPEHMYVNQYDAYIEEYVSAYHLGSNRILFYSDRLSQFSISDNRLYVKIGECTLRVGSPAITLATHFPISWANRQINTDEGFNYAILSISSIENGQVKLTDEWVSIVWGSNGMITQIQFTFSP